jgi:2,4-dienoyl-CoA reductase-like NADH-dependent reductase (Old Yellow Enzyme family)
MNKELKNLFSAININTMQLKNRAVMPAMATVYGNSDSTVSDRLISYLERRAEGGVGLIIAEVCAIDPRGRGLANEIGVWNDSFIPGLSMLAEAGHRHDGKIALQLHHAGRETMEILAGMKPEAPSDLPSPTLKQECEAMTIGRVREVVNEYAEGARRAKAAGFDAVEIHGAHGYLIHQFLSPFSNKRSDEYGGSDANRSRFLLEILGAVRGKVGADFPLIVRFSGEECIKGGFDLDFTRMLAVKLADAGADALHVSVGVYSTPGFFITASMDTPEGFNLFRAAEIKNMVDIPVIGVGRVIDPRMADRAIGSGDVDLVSMGRQLLADPDVLVKAREGRYDDIRWCLGCNQGCVDRLMLEFKPITCSINPECGCEDAARYGKAGRQKKVWVIGAGPAGLSAALAAGKRGHAVSLFDRETVPGGQLVSASRPPYKQGFQSWVVLMGRELTAAGVSIQYGTAVTERMLLEERPDKAILATGALSITPQIRGIDSGIVHDARDVLLGKVELKGPAVILGGGYVAMETADFCIERGIAVTVVEMSRVPPVTSVTAHGYWLNRRLKGGGTLMLGTTVTAVEGNAVVVNQDGRESRIEPVSMVIKALGAVSENDIGQVLKKLGIPYEIAGDAVKPRRLLEAVHEGDAAGRSIE